jgi:serine/threonine protein kinase
MNARILALDPLMERFVVPANVYRTHLQTLKDSNRPLYESFVHNCLDDPAKVPSHVYIGSMPILRQIHERLNPYYRNYVLESLRILHSNGIAHNDIHPGNIMFHRVGENDYPVIIDFGLVSHHSEDTNDINKFNEYFVQRAPEIKRDKRRRPSFEL